jgi:hypothetical protein
LLDSELQLVTLFQTAEKIHGTWMQRSLDTKSCKLKTETSVEMAETYSFINLQGSFLSSVEEYL